LIKHTHTYKKPLKQLNFELAIMEIKERNNLYLEFADIAVRRKKKKKKTDRFISVWDLTKVLLRLPSNFPVSLNLG